VSESAYGDRLLGITKKDHLFHRVQNRKRTTCFDQQHIPGSTISAERGRTIKKGPSASPAIAFHRGHSFDQASSSYRSMKQTFGLYTAVVDSPWFSDSPSYGATDIEKVERLEAYALEATYDF